MSLLCIHPYCWGDHPHQTADQCYLWSPFSSQHFFKRPFYFLPQYWPALTVIELWSQEFSPYYGKQHLCIYLIQHLCTYIYIQALTAVSGDLWFSSIVQTKTFSPIWATLRCPRCLHGSDRCRREFTGVASSLLGCRWRTDGVIYTSQMVLSATHRWLNPIPKAVHYKLKGVAIFGKCWNKVHNNR